MEEKTNIERLYDLPIEKLLLYKEDECFDRTEGGQESLGIKIASFGTKNGGILVVGQRDLAKGGEVIGIGEEFQKEFTQAISNVKPAPLTKSKIVDPAPQPKQCHICRPGETKKEGLFSE